MFYTSDIYSSEICQNSHSSVPSCWFMQNQSQIRRPHYNFQICCLFRLQCSVLHFNSIFLISLRKVFNFSFTQHFIIITMQWKFLSSLHTRLSISSIKFSCSVMSNFWGPIELQHARPHCPYQLPESTQTRVHWVGDTIQPSHLLSSPSPPALNLSHHQGIFKWVSSSYQVAKVLEFQLQHQSFQWTPRTDL